MRRAGHFFLLCTLIAGLVVAHERGFGRLAKGIPREDGGRRDSGVAGARETIRARDLSTLLHRLCSDFHGRKSASEGERMTAEFIAARFKKWGLKPAGRNGTYLQDFRVDSRRARGTGWNVMGYLEGSDPVLKDEIVAVGAHIDAVGGSGADDDGSGTASMMELAEACASLGKKPKRTLLFIGWGSEEAWMVGSYHFARHPTRFSIRDVGFYLNLDMVGRNDRTPGQVVIAGSESSDPSVRPIIEKFLPVGGLAVKLEKPMRSPPGDAMPFYENGVPFLYFYTYTYGRVHADYHKPSDTPDKIDYASQEKITRLVFDILLEIAGMDRLPRCVDGYRFPHPARAR